MRNLSELARPIFGAAGPIHVYGWCILTGGGDAFDTLCFTPGLTHFVSEQRALGSALRSALLRSRSGSRQPPVGV
jgi:hypothetical protein